MRNTIGVLHACEWMALAILFWMVASVPAAIVWTFLQRLFPGGGAAAARRILRLRSPRGDLLRQLAERLNGAHAAIAGKGEARLLLDRRHAALQRTLTEMRASLESRLGNLEKSSVASSYGDLQKRMDDFTAKLPFCPRFDLIPHDIADNIVALKHARAQSTFSLISSLIVAALNMGLILIFADELFSDFYIPMTKVSIALPFSGFFPVIEYVMGHILREATQNTSRVERYLYVTLCVFVIFVLASFEYIMFSRILSSESVLSTVIGPKDFIASVIPFLGPAITLMLVMSSYSHATASHKVRELEGIRNLKPN